MELQFLRDLLKFPCEGEEEEYRSLFNEDNQFLTGLLPFVQEKLTEVDHPFDIEGECFYDSGTLYDIPPDLLPGITLRDYQISTVQKLLYAKRGIVSVAGGGGKTLTAIAAHSFLSSLDPSHRTLFVVNTELLAEQTINNFELFSFSSSRVTGGDLDTNNLVAVALVQTLYSRLKRQDPDVLNLLKYCNLIVFDEAHHVPAASWSSVGQVSEAEYRLALTATPFEHSMKPETFRDYSLIGIAGPVFLHMDVPTLVSRGILARPLVTFMKPLVKEFKNTWDWSKVYKRGVVESEARNNAGLNLALSLYQRDYKVLILVQQVKHGKILCRLLHEKGYQTPIFSYGGNSFFSVNVQGDEEELDWTAKDVYEHLDGSESYIFIGSSIYDQGVDVPSLNCLVIMSGMKRLRTTLQRVYRALRSKDSDIGNTALVFDFYDRHHPYLLKQSKTRRQLYEDIGFEVYEDSNVLDRILTESIG